MSLWSPTSSVLESVSGVCSEAHALPDLPRHFHGTLRVAEAFIDRFRVSGAPARSSARLAGLLASILVSSPVLAETADQILTQHRKALGGDSALAKLSSCIHKGSVTEGSASGTFTWSTLSPLLYGEETTLYGQTWTASVTGRTAWVQAPNGVTTRASGITLDRLQGMDLLIGLGYLNPADFELEPGEPKKSADGKSWILPLTGRTFPELELTFDAGSWLLTRAIVKSKGGKASYVYVLGGHKKFGGISFPTQIEQSLLPGTAPDSSHPVVKYAVANVERSTELEESRFERPVEVKKLPVFPAGQTKVSVPMPYTIATRAVGVMASVQGGASQYFLLDSARDISVLDGTLAQGLNLPTAGKKVNDETGASLPLFAVSSLGVENVVLPPTVVQLEDLKALSASLGKPVAGILGLELFEHMVVEIRYSDGRIDLHAPGSYTDRGTGEALPLDESGRVNVLLNGQAMLSAVLSTRQSLALQAPGTLLQHENLLPDAAKRLTPELAWIKADGPGFVGAFSSLQLGNAILQNVVTFFPEKDPKLPGGGVVLGNALLEHFHVTFDRGRRQVIVEANPWYARGSSYNRTGIQLKAGPPLEVVAVHPGSEGGLEKGDVLTGVQIGGVWTTDLKLIEQTVLANEVSRLKVRVKRNKKELEKELVLKDLF